MSDESLHALLGAVEREQAANDKRHFETLKPVRAALRRALGLKEEDQPSYKFQPGPPPQKVVGEFPYLLAKFDSSYNEVGRKICESLDEHGRICRAGDGFNTKLPIDTPLPPTSCYVGRDKPWAT